LVEILFVDENTGYALERMNGRHILKLQMVEFLGQQFTIVILQESMSLQILASNPKVIFSVESAPIR
jgi:hypothetical protein